MQGSLSNFYFLLAFVSGNPLKSKKQNKLWAEQFHKLGIYQKKKIYIYMHVHKLFFIIIPQKEREEIS